MKSVDVIPATLRLRGAKMIAVAVILYLALRLVGFHRLFENDAEGIGALLQIIGTLYSVVYAFAIYVIWGQFTSVENEIQKESGALKDAPFQPATERAGARTDRTSREGLCQRSCGYRVESAGCGRGA